MHTLYTLGYTGIAPELIAAAAQAQNALIVDTRLNAASRHPRWHKGALTRLLADHYLHLPALGNRNYKTGGEVVIDKPDAAVPQVVNYLAAQPVILMCACADVNRCHRKVVAALVQAASGCEVEHIGAAELQAWVDPPPQQLTLL